MKLSYGMLKLVIFKMQRNWKELHLYGGGAGDEKGKGENPGEGG